MADTKATALTGFTPVLTDILYGVDDPGGTPVSGKVTFQQAMDLFEANMTVPASVSAVYQLQPAEGAFVDGDKTKLDGIATGADAWGTPIDSSITVDTDSTYDLGTTAARIANGFFDQVYASGALVMTEVSDNPVTPTAGIGQLWTSDDTTQKLMFTDDAGTDKEVAFVTGGTDLSAYTGVLGLNSGTAVDVNTKALLEARLSDVSDLAEADGDVWTGVHDFGGATSLEIPNSATPTVDAAGEIAIDTTVTDWSHGILEYFSGETMGVVAMPIAQFTTPSDGAVPTYNATNDEFEMSVPAGSGDVSKVGTPVDGQVGVWTGNGTIEGDAALTFDTSVDRLAIAASGKLAFGAVDILSDSAGTTTLSNIDALDAGTEATIEAAIDTLANLASIQGHTFTLTGAFTRSGAHALTLTTTATTNVTFPTSGTLLQNGDIGSSVQAYDADTAKYDDTTANFTGTLQNGGSNVVVDTDIGSTVQAYDADTLKSDTADQLTAGFTAAVDDDGAAASPYTPDPDTGNYKRLTNDGAMTINAPTMASGEATSMIILLTNTTGAGAITFGTTTDSGDTIGTTTTDEYLISITAVDVGGTTYSHATVKALQ